MAAAPSRLYLPAAVGRAVDPRRRYHGQAAVRAAGGRRGRLQPAQAGPPSHTHHTYAIAELRLILEVEVQAGNQHLVVVGLVFIVGLWPLTIPMAIRLVLARRRSLRVSRDDPGHLCDARCVLDYRASRDPMAHRSLIWFTVWSSIVHAAIMAVQLIVNPQHIGHLWGEVLALIVVAAALAALTPRRRSSSAPLSAA